MDDEAEERDGGEVWAEAGGIQDAASARASTAPDAERRGKGCFIEWLGL
jgi:hypothetical protein